MIRDAEALGQRHHRNKNQQQVGSAFSTAPQTDTELKQKRGEVGAAAPGSTGNFMC